MDFLFVCGILILALTASLLENFNSIKVITTSDLPIRKVDIDGYSKKLFY